MWATLLAFACLGPAAAQAENYHDSIRAFVERVNEASTSFFSSGSETEARERAHTLLSWAFDIPAMTKEALGFTWDTVTEEERSKLMEAFKEDVVGAYLRRMRPEGTTLAFVGHRPPVEGNYFAASRRSVPGKKDQIWIWSIRPDNASWRITDLILNGRSAVGAQRQEYRSVLESNHGEMNALIAFMRKRAAQ